MQVQAMRLNDIFTNKNHSFPDKRIFYRTKLPAIYTVLDPITPITLIHDLITMTSLHSLSTFTF